MPATVLESATNVECGADSAGRKVTSKPRMWSKTLKTKVKLSVNAGGRNSNLTTSKLTQLAALSAQSSSGDKESFKLINELADSESTISIDDLKFIRKLGEGGFANVELREWTKPDGSTQLVAVKVLKDKVPGPRNPITPDAPPPMLPVPEDERAHFKTEALLQKVLHHGNVVQSYGLAHGTDKLMFVQECCSGGSLLDKIKRPGSYTSRQALQWALDTARGLAYLQGDTVTISIAHRDLKPENILINDKGVAKIADFGLSRMMDPVVKARRQSQMENSEAGGAMLPSVIHDQFGNGDGSKSKPMSLTQKTGTARYMAPECWTSTEYGRKVDVFSYAIMVSCTQPRS